MERRVSRVLPTQKVANFILPFLTLPRRLFQNLAIFSSAKRIQIFFRGTETSRDTNDPNRDAEAFLSYMPVPPVLKKIIEDNAELNEKSLLVGEGGKAIDGIPVHRGFYGEWLFTSYTQVVHNL